MKIPDLLSHHIPLVAVTLAVLLLLDVGLVLSQSVFPSGAPGQWPQSIAASFPATTTDPSAQGTPPEATAQTAATIDDVAPTIAPVAVIVPQPATVAPADTPTAQASPIPAASPLPSPTPAAAQTTKNALPLPPLGCNDSVGHLVTEPVKSRVLVHPLQVQVYLPPCYDPNRYSYPTLYLIQGSGYVIGEWATDGATRVADQLMAQGKLPPFIIVMPGNDGMAGYGSRYMYTSRGKGSWEDFFVNELVPWVDGKYSTWQSRDGRAIGGISRGGYWSLEIAFTHPDQFSVAGGHSPAITSDFLAGTPAGFNMTDMARSMDVLKKLRIYLDAGRDDVTQQGVYQLAVELGAHQIRYTGSIPDGAHDDTYWSAHMHEYLAFYSADWPHAPRSNVPRTIN